jgi:hypothetical protein
VRLSIVMKKKKNFGQKSWFLFPNSLFESLLEFPDEQLHLLLSQKV